MIIIMAVANDSSTSTNWIGWGALILAFLGVIEFWFAVIWRRYFRKGEIEFYVNPRIEISYNNFGPTLALRGTFRAIRKDVFIERINLKVISKEDNSEHSFEWLFFRPNVIFLSKTHRSDLELELASGFIVTTNNPKVMNVFFGDSSTQKKIEKVLKPAYDRFIELLKEKQKDSSHVIYIDKKDTEMEAMEILEKYEKDQTQVDAWSKLGRINYWKEGSYKILLEIHAKEPDRVLPFKYEFELPKENAETLELNTLKIVSLPTMEIGVKEPTWWYVFPEIV
ncbi:MAG: hypothetical protein E3J72_19865 [Planctomycetota bacterium]|nr:MAG: hypothetical protein E3J72_19865 [Planctomycetota bacterium]